MSGTQVEFSSLTPAQQAQVLAFMTNFRPAIGAISVALRNLSALSNAYAAAIGPVLATVDPASPIPDTTGLAGAQPLACADVTTVMGMVAAVISTYYAQANLAEYIKIVGPVNV